MYLSKQIARKAQKAFEQAKNGLEKRLLQDGFAQKAPLLPEEGFCSPSFFDTWLDQIALFYFKGIYTHRLALYQIAYILTLLANFQEAADQLYALCAKPRRTSSTAKLDAHV